MARGSWPTSPRQPVSWPWRTPSCSARPTWQRMPRCRPCNGRSRPSIRVQGAACSARTRHWSRRWRAGRMPRRGGGLSNWLRAFAQPVAGRHGMVSSFSLTLDAPIGRAAFLAGISLVQERYGQGLLRLKGLVCFEGETLPCEVHGVHGELYPLRTLPQWPSDERASRLVCILRGPDAAEVQACGAPSASCPHETVGARIAPLCRIACTENAWKYGINGTVLCTIRDNHGSLESHAGVCRGRRQRELVGGGRAFGHVRAMVSRYLAEMEQWVGVRLLHRTTRRLSLTPAGAETLPRCRQMLDMVGICAAPCPRPTIRPRGCCGSRPACRSARVIWRASWRITSSCIRARRWI